MTILRREHHEPVPLPRSEQAGPQSAFRATRMISRNQHSKGKRSVVSDGDPVRHITVRDEARLTTAETATVTVRETWADWLGAEAIDPDALLTREEVLGQLQAKGIAVSRYDVRNWERKGVLPLGIPRRIGRSYHARYPPKAVVALAYIRQLQ